MPSMDDKSTIYSKACDAFSRKDYEEALELFTELNGWLDSKEKAQACQIRIANPDYDNIIRQQQEKSMQFSQSVEKHHIKINKKANAMAVTASAASMHLVNEAHINLAN